ncbi:hypothetical protein [Microcoleus sp. FACHB-68]|uniref:hypothetical protein n=1 Tax=Microcoleus sp. FACHB-68 TaxID=2692826 RepID=UPI001F549251|nr:hypothetical protein [Microcoleus sp. FACHB-68]
MPQSKLDEPEPPPLADEPESSSVLNFEQWIEALKSSDRLFYNMMAIEVWSIAKTMDTLFPGFWNRFMTNRRFALQEFIKQKKAAQSQAMPSPPDGEP